MYLHTRLLLGIAAVTLAALLLSVLVPLSSVRPDADRETEGALQLTTLLMQLQERVHAAPDAAAALAAAAGAVRESRPLRHVRITLQDPAGRGVATTPVDSRQGGWLAAEFAGDGDRPQLSVPLTFGGATLGTLRLTANPRAEVSEIEERAESDLLLLVLVILAMAAAVYSMVRWGLRPVGQIQTALAQLQAGKLDTRLPHFRIQDLDDISGSFNHCAQALQSGAEQRRTLSLRLTAVEEDERRRLARELHDELGQSLTAIKVDAAFMEREARAVLPKVEDCARGVGEIVDGIMALTRSMLSRLRPHELETIGLRATLADLVSGWQARMAGRFSCALEFSGPLDGLSPQLNITLYRLVQECLTNAVRHSRARAIAIRCRAGDGRVELQVAESDVAPGTPADSGGGTGLDGMRERVEAQGGALRILWQPAGGMLLTASLPVAASTGD
ncbi:MAG TPA: HAMP domain-containing sensor histidine kinase [Steroidobacteraceae bacterium]|nr:HAMP domain-containing sensor histidine kinase [Steroidobacteraceae bacterium]